MTNSARMTGDFNVDPQNVYALVVGIETYQLGADYDLDGPARDGLRFIDWLRSQGVPPENIRFFVSPLAQNADVKSQAAKLGSQTLPATRDAIDKFIRDELVVASGEVLYVFWGGHGILTKTNEPTRQLLFADTTAANKLSLNIRSLEQALATSKHGLGFERQLFVVDACANRYFQDLYDVIQGKVGEQRYASTGELSKAEQVVMFACADYEVAKNVAGAGVFSSVVLAELENHSLLPNMTLLLEKVRDRLSMQGMPKPFYRSTKVDNQETISHEGMQQKKANLPLNDQLNNYLNNYNLNNNSLDIGKQIKVKRLQLQLSRIRQQHEAESALLGEASGAIAQQRQQTLERLEGEIEQLVAQLRELMS